jgi:predicted O-methyltransferase YrrM
MAITWREAVFKALHEKNAVQRQIARRLFVPFQAAGFQLTADHFYDPIPNTKLIEKSYVDDARPCLGIDLRFAESEARLLDLCRKYESEILDGDIYRCGFRNQNSYFSDVDAITLYLLIRETQPSTIIEVGQGMSTKVTAAACRKNWEKGARKTKLVTIDPHARVTADELKGEWMEVEALRMEVQAADDRQFAALKPNDLLFIDSSHVFKFGSDVEYEFDSIYPQVPPGVLIHIHDIFTPFNYPKRWLVQRKQFWNEQYYLEQFLRFNTDYEVVLPVHCLVRKSAAIRNLIQEKWAKAGYVAGGGSFYIKRVVA